MVLVHLRVTTVLQFKRINYEKKLSIYSAFFYSKRKDITMTNNVIPAGGNKKLDSTNFTLSHNLDISVDVSIYLLQQDGKVTGDEGMVFYGAPNSSSGGVALNQGKITFNLDRIPINIAKISIASTVDTGNFSSKPSFSVSSPEVTCQYNRQSRSGTYPNGTISP